MRILMITSELAPLSKVGGLADMVAGLTGYLASRGHEVMVVTPDYGARQLSGSARLQAGGEAVECAMRRAPVEGAQVWQLGCPEYFGDQAVYRGDVRDAKRFVLLSLAALEHARSQGFAPDVVHAHDWHASPVVTLLRNAPQADSPPSLLTIHNIGYQGTFAPGCLAETPFADCEPMLQDGHAGGINFLRAGIVAAHALSTVSPTHAEEILTPQYGMGLESLLASRRDRLYGILNGADYALWSPESDTHLAAPFSAQDLSGKRVNRQQVAASVGLDVPHDVPLVCMVGRLMGQKGIDRVLEALPALLREESFSAIFLGDGEAHYTQALMQLAGEWPGRVALRQGHDEVLAHRLLAGSDMLLMPSRYEPCGLTQLYAMRYGTVPVVRATGGLADTVQHFSAGSGEGTGVVFRDDDAGGLQWALRQGLAWFAQPRLWGRLVQNAMAQDYSWARQGAHYEALYRGLGRAGRAGGEADLSFATSRAPGR